MDTTLKIKAVHADSIEIEGYGVVFGGRDLEGDTFTKDTDFMLDLVPVKPITFNHTQDMAEKVPEFLREMVRGLPVIKDAIGFVSNENIKKTDVGLWIEATVQTSKEYLDYVKEAAKRGLLGLSSSTAPAFMTIDQSSKITRWPIVEIAITPIPAEPRTLGISEIKSLYDAAGLELPQAFNEAREGERGTEKSGETDLSERAQVKARIFLVGG